MEKSENIEFFRNVLACDLKGGRYKQHINNDNVCIFKGKVIS